MNSCVVLKIGGSLNNRHLEVVAEAVRVSFARGVSVVVVHGGGPAISRALQNEGISLPFVNGQRVTSKEAISTIHRVLTRELNPTLVESLTSCGVPARGYVTGVLFAKGIKGLQQTGQISRVHTIELLNVMTAGEVPVLSPVADSEDESLPYNVNADSAAASVASALRASKLVFLTDVPGIYADWEAGHRLQTATQTELLHLMAAGAFQSGMIPKVEAAQMAASLGVRDVYVVLGSELEAVLDALAHNRADPWNSPFGTWIQGFNNLCEGSDARERSSAADAELWYPSSLDGSRSRGLPL